MRFLAFILLTSCSSVQTYVYHDVTNPCTRGQVYYNAMDCEWWAENYTLEYNQYLTRCINNPDQFHVERFKQYFTVTLK